MENRWVGEDTYLLTAFRLNLGRKNSGYLSPLTQLKSGHGVQPNTHLH